MRIAVIDTTIHGPLIGGAQTFLPVLLRGLAARGHEVHLLAKGKPDPRIESELGAVSVDINVWEGPGIAEDVAPRLAKWLGSLKPDLFAVSTCPDIGWVTLPLLEPRVATVSIAHADMGAYYLPLTHYSRFVSRSVGVSPQICGKLSGQCGMSEDRVDWIPYGVRASANAPATVVGSEGTPMRLVYVGRLAEEHKRVSDLGRLAKELTFRGIDYSFDVVGDGPMMSVLREMMGEEIGKGSVRLRGWLGNDDLVERLRSSEVSVLVSDSEGFPIAVVEAMANGCAPIVTDIEAGTSHLVRDGVNGFICRVGDMAAFADKIQLLAKDRELLGSLRTEAWKTGGAFSIEKMIDRYEECFSKAVAHGVGAPRTSDERFPLMPSCTSPYPLWARRGKLLVKKMLGMAV